MSSWELKIKNELKNYSVEKKIEELQKKINEIKNKRDIKILIKTSGDTFLDSLEFIEKNSQISNIIILKSKILSKFNFLKNFIFLLLNVKDSKLREIDDFHTFDKINTWYVDVGPSVLNIHYNFEEYTKNTRLKYKQFGGYYLISLMEIFMRYRGDDSTFYHYKKYYQEALFFIIIFILQYDLNFNYGRTEGHFNLHLYESDIHGEIIVQDENMNYIKLIENILNYNQKNFKGNSLLNSNKVRVYPINTFSWKKDKFTVEKDDYVFLNQKNYKKKILNYNKFFYPGSKPIYYYFKELPKVIILETDVIFENKTRKSTPQEMTILKNNLKQAFIINYYNKPIVYKLFSVLINLETEINIKFQSATLFLTTGGWGKNTAGFIDYFNVSTLTPSTDDYYKIGKNKGYPKLLFYSMVTEPNLKNPFSKVEYPMASVNTFNNFKTDIFKKLVKERENELNGQMGRVYNNIDPNLAPDVSQLLKFNIDISHYASIFSAGLRIPKNYIDSEEKYINFGQIEARVVQKIEDYNNPRRIIKDSFLFRNEYKHKICQGCKLRNIYNSSIFWKQHKLSFCSVKCFYDFITTNNHSIHGIDISSLQTFTDGYRNKISKYFDEYVERDKRLSSSEIAIFNTLLNVIKLLG